MENLLLSLNVVAPLMLYIAIGVLLRRTRVLDEKSCRDISRVVFYAALPALCFSSIVKADFSAIFGDPFTLYLVMGILILFFACMVIVPHVCPDNRRRGVLVQSIFRSNDGIFGLAVAAALMGAENMGLMTMSVALSVPLFNTLAVIDMETFRGGRVRVGTIVKKVLLSPVVIACMLAAAVNLLGLRLPEAFSVTLDKLGGACAPIGFLALGGTLSFASVRENIRAISVVSLLRLVASPVIFVGALYLMGYRGDFLLVGLILFGAPTAMSTYAMACAMNGDEALASGTVAVTSVLSILTMFIFIFLLKQLGVS